MQAQAAESSGYAGPFRCFLKEEFKNGLVASVILNHALKQTPRRLFESFLARNEHVDSPRA